MTIKTHQGPADGWQVTSEAISTRTRRVEAGVSPLGGASHLAQPVPFYHLPLDKIDSNDPLAFATSTGWRYPIVGGDRPGLADIRGDEGSTGSKFAGLSHGILAKRFLEASTLADTQLGDGAEEFEPRILDIPALGYAALWLLGQQSQRFISLLEGNPPGTAPLQMVTDIVPQLRAVASKRVLDHARATLSGRASPGSPTN